MSSLAALNLASENEKKFGDLLTRMQDLNNILQHFIQKNGDFAFLDLVEFTSINALHALSVNFNEIHKIWCTMVNSYLTKEERDWRYTKQIRWAQAITHDRIKQSGDFESKIQRSMRVNWRTKKELDTYIDEIRIAAQTSVDLPELFSRATFINQSFKS